MKTLFKTKLTLLSIGLLTLTACGGSSDSTLVPTIPEDFNLAPAALTQTRIIDEDTTLAITLAGTDLDGSITSYTLTTQPNNGTLTGSGANLIYTPTLNFNGTDTFAFTVTDDDGETSDPVNIDIIINPVNDAPVVAFNINNNVSENTSATGLLLNLFVTDPELDDISISLGETNDSALFSIDVGTTELQFNSVPNFESPIDSNADNNYQVSVIYTDTEGLDVSDVININVTNQTDIEMFMTFPTPNANLGGVSEITLKGTFNDSEDDTVLSSDVLDIMVNGTQAFLTNNNENWFITLPTTDQSIDVNFEVFVNNESVFTDTQQVINITQPPSIEVPFDGALDSENNRLIVLDLSNDSIMELDLSTNTLKIISDRNNGTGTEFDNIRKFSLDKANNRVFVIDTTLDAIFTVDLTTGERTVIASNEIGTGVELNFTRDIVYDEESNQLYIIENNTLINIDLDSGNRVSLAEFTVSSSIIGFEFDSTNNIVYLLTNDSVLRTDLFGDNVSTIFTSDNTLTQSISLNTNKTSLFLSTLSTGVVIELNLSTLENNVLSSAEVGTGINFDRIRAIITDASNDQLFVLDSSIEGIINTEISSGNRELLVNTNNEKNFLDPRGVVIDRNNNRLLVLDETILYAVDISGTNTSGNISIISGNNVGTGPDLVNADEINFDPDNNRILVTSGESINDKVLINIDLNTGNRSQIVEFNTFIDDTVVLSMALDTINNSIFYTHNDDPDLLLMLNLNTLLFSEVTNLITEDNISLGLSRTLVLDIPNNIIYLADTTLDVIASVNLLTNITTIISSDDIGTGPVLNFVSGLTLDSTNNRLLLTDNSIEQVISVDLTSGNRTTISESLTGLRLDGTADFALDSENNRLFIPNFFEDNIYVIDIETGEGAYVTH